MRRIEVLLAALVLAGCTGSVPVRQLPPPPPPPPTPAPLPCPTAAAHQPNKHELPELPLPFMEDSSGLDTPEATTTTQWEDADP